jgi:hypothetical protein
MIKVGDMVRRKNFAGWPHGKEVYKVVKITSHYYDSEVLSIWGYILSDSELQWIGSKDVELVQQEEIVL